MVKDYTKVTAQGHKVVGFYIAEVGSWVKHNVILAVIDKGKSAQAYDMPRYLWAYNYHFDDGIWGQGHYNFYTIQEAVADLKSEYPKVKAVKNPKTAITRIVSNTDTFGVFSTKSQAMKRLYALAKGREGDGIRLMNYDGSKILYSTVYDRESNMVFAYSASTSYRLMASGELRKVGNRYGTRGYPGIDW